MNKIFILLPALKDEGPSRGAIAIANGLSNKFDVSLVVLKKIYKYKTYVKPNVRIIMLNESWLWISNFHLYNKILNSESNKKPISISMGFSADLLNLFARRKAIVIASVRASIPKNYITTYGFKGRIYARMHAFILQRMDYVLSLSLAMSKQLSNLNIKRVKEVGNFIDEVNLEKYRIDAEIGESRLINFVFIGSLTSRKKVDLILDSAQKLKRAEIQVNIDIVGDGELKPVLEEKIRTFGLDESVLLHGFHPEPYNILQTADYFILPSIAEGVSRASLEALFFGVPCILRNVDANAELIEHGVNGYLFDTDDQFTNLLQKLASSNKVDIQKEHMIPNFFSYKHNIEKLTKLIHEINI